MDGVEIPLLYHLLGGPSVVNPEFLDRIDFLPGGFGPRYGHAIGGVVDTHTRRGAQDGPHGSFKVDLLDSAAFAESPVGEKTSVALAARRSYEDTLLPYVIPEDPINGSISVLPRYWDYQLRLDHGLKSDRNSFTLMAFGSDDKLAVAATGGARDRDLQLGVHTAFHRLCGAWAFRDGPFTSTFSPWLGWDDATMELGSGEGSLGGGATQPSLGLREEVSWELPGGHVFRVGADVKVAEVQFKVTIPQVGTYPTFPGADPTGEPQTLERNIADHDYGFYAESLLKPTDRLSVTKGLRIDRYRLHGVPKIGADPRLSGRYAVSDATQVKGSLGLYSQAPEATQFDPKFGNPDVDLEKAFQTSLGVEHKFTDAVNLDVTGFYTRRYDLVVGTNKVVRRPDGTVRALRFENEGLGRAYGLELLLRHEVTERFFGWVAYTLSRSESRRRGAWPYYPDTFDQPHIMTLVAQYKLGGGFEIGSRFRLVSGRPDTPYLDSTFDADTSRYAPVAGERASERLPVFHQLDLRLDKSWLFEQWRLGAYLDVQNAYWADNAESCQWDYRYRKRETVPGIPILPTIGLKGSY